MPTPPIGDMACAASPMHSSPGLCQRGSRSTATVNSFTSSQLLISPSRSRRNGDMKATLSRKASSPSAFTASMPPLRDHIGALPIVGAVEHHHHAAGFHMAEGLRGVARAPRDAEPEHVHRRADVLDLEAGARAHRRMPPVGADHEIGADLELALRRVWRARRRRARPPRSGRSLPCVMCRSKAGYVLPCSARKSRKSHCGISAMNLQCVGRWLKSASAMVVSPTWPLEAFDARMRQLEEIARAGRARASIRASRDGWCRRGNRAGSRRAFPAP